MGPLEGATLLEEEHHWEPALLASASSFLSLLTLNALNMVSLPPGCQAGSCSSCDTFPV